MSADRRAISFVIAAALVFAAGVARAEPPPCTLDRATGIDLDKAHVFKSGYGARWNLATGRVAFMGENAQGFYRIFTATPDGKDETDIADATPGLAKKHQGMPFWHPSGKYLVIAAEKPEWKDADMFGNRDFGALPGFGTHDDLWIVTADGARAWKLTDLPNIRTEGELLPVFSPDGRKLGWTERQPDKTYEIKVADFLETPEPHIANVRTYTPGGRVFYELGSFTSDSKQIAYTGDQDTHSFWANQIYLLDLATGASRRLTQGRAYSEHPIVFNTPTGDWIVYMTARDENRGFLRMTGTDWWAVKPDGTGTKRLSYMNVRGSPQFFDKVMVAITVAPGPRGDTLLADVQNSLVHQTGFTMKARFVCR